MSLTQLKHEQDIWMISGMINRIKLLFWTFLYIVPWYICCQVWEAAGSAGLLGSSIPAEEGGGGGETLTAAIVLEEM